MEKVSFQTRRAQQVPIPAAQGFHQASVSPRVVSMRLQSTGGLTPPRSPMASQFFFVAGFGGLKSLSLTAFTFSPTGAISTLPLSVNVFGGSHRDSLQA